MRPFDRELEQITMAVLRLAALVEERVRKAIRSLCDGRPDLAGGVIRGDAVIDRLEVRIEEDCLTFLARHDPLAGDLRRIAAMLKINHELERMADEAVSTARRALAMGEIPLVGPIPQALEVMGDRVVAMVRDSLDAFINADALRARDVIARDDDVDRLHQQMVKTLKGLIQEHPNSIEARLHLFSAAAHLERIADHATNISEEVVYLAEGSIIRHRHEGATGIRASSFRRPGDQKPANAAHPLGSR